MSPGGGELQQVPSRYPEQRTQASALSELKIPALHTALFLFLLARRAGTLEQVRTPARWSRDPEKARHTWEEGGPLSFTGVLSAWLLGSTMHSGVPGFATGLRTLLSRSPQPTARRFPNPWAVWKRHRGPKKEEFRRKNHQLGYGFSTVLITWKESTNTSSSLPGTMEEAETAI